jgi:hypothetical protein
MTAGGVRGGIPVDASRATLVRSRVTQYGSTARNRRAVGVPLTHCSQPLGDADVEWLTWSPRTETIALPPAFGPVLKRGTVTLALAHRALGHWGCRCARTSRRLGVTPHQVRLQLGCCRCLTNVDIFHGIQM